MSALRLLSVLLALCIVFVEVKSQPPSTCADLKHCERLPQPGGRPPTFYPDHPGLPGTCDDLNHCSRSPQPGGRPPTHGEHNPDTDPMIGGAARG